MNLPPGYKLDEIVRPGAVLRAREIDSGQSVIIKTAADESSPEALASLRHEYTILSRLNVRGVVRARALLNWEQRPYLVLDDLGTVPLRTLMNTRSVSLEVFFTVANALGHVLQQVHHARVIHKNITPDNIIVHPQTFEAHLIDFSIASILPRETQELASPQVLEGQLEYISPEQTGRMNRAIDPRTDFYSLGITLYELLTGHLPFTANSPLEWIHCHIAKTPLPLSETGANVPAALDAIVMKLFEKAAENRYQSAYGLLHDLKACQQLSSGSEASFTAGQYDRSEHFQLPQKLYGRQSQIDTLLSAFDAVSRGKTAMMLVAGYSGIGKTSLIAEIHKPIVRDNGYFISGKFDQLKRDIPYASLIQAFRELVRQLLTESEASLERWRHRLRKALGRNGQVIVDVIPDVAMIIGQQPKTQKLEPAETQNRFNRVFQDFVRTFAGPRHPLAIFLDDLQWADAASLRLLQLLCTDPSSSHVFLIGAYRDNEVDAAHSLTHMLQEIAGTGAHIDTLVLQPLDQPDVEQLVADALRMTTAAVAELAQLVHEKTLGNPFFVNQCLRELHESGLLSYHPHDNRWGWDLEHIRSIGLTDNVIELMAAKIRRLAEPTQNALTLAACIGSDFDVATLAIVGEYSIRQTAALLSPALDEGLVLPSNDACRVLQRTGGELTTIELRTTITCRFLHDRVQQAAYSLLPEENKQAVHLKIGRRMLENLSSAEAQLFDVVNHMNLGSALIDDSIERIELADLNLLAGLKAKDSTAYASAAGYLRAGTRLLPKTCWDSHFHLAFGLYKGLAECAYLLGYFDEAEELFDRLLGLARHRHDKAAIFNIRIAFYSSVGRFTDAINAGFEGLLLYGIDLRSAGSDLTGAIERALAEVQEQLGDRAPSALLELPPMSDPVVEDSMHLLMNLTTQTYIADQDWFPLIAIKMVSLSLEHGNCTASSFAYGYLGVILGTLRGDYETGRLLGELSLELNKALNEPKLYCKLYWILGGLNNHWTRHIRSNVGLLRSSVQHGQQSGDYVFGSWAYYYLVISALLSGQKLALTLAEAEGALAFFRKIKNQTYADQEEIVRNVVLNLQGATEDTRSLSNDTFDEVACIRDMRARSHGPGLGRYHVLKLMVLCINEHYEEACELGAASEQTLRYLTAQPLLAEHSFYYSISLCSHYPHADAEQRQIYRATIEQNLARLDAWAASCPENFLHKKLLIEAEIARLDDRAGEAMDRYARAIESAQTHGFMHNEALAHLLAGHFFLKKQHVTAAHAHLQSAHDRYADWGAERRARELAAAYPAIRRAHDTAQHITGEHARSTHASLDAMTLVKATRAISGELRLDSLLNTMMQIMIESAGATKGYLFQEEHGVLALKTRSRADVAAEAELPQFSESVVNYVRRTGERVVLGDAVHSATFGTDPYIEDEQIRSLLCIPMRRKDIVIGTLYFENALLENAFTSTRVDIIEILAAQAAVSLENARLYGEVNALNEALEARVEERTAELSKKNADIGAMLGNLRQGICTILPDGLLHHEYSLHLEEMLQTSAIAGRDACDLIFENASLGADTLHGIETVLTTCLGQDMLNFELNEHALIRTFQRQVGSELRTFELDWVPLVNKANIVERIMLTLRDGTELRALQAQTGAQRLELQVVGRLIGLSTAEYNATMTGATTLLDECERALITKHRPSGAKLQSLFRALHTIKGDARSHSWTEVADAAHQAEDVLDALRQPEAHYDREQLREALDRLRATLDHYAHVWRATLDRASPQASALSVSPEWVDGLLELMTSAAPALEDARAQVMSLGYMRLDEVLDRPSADVRRLAATQAKSPPNVRLTGARVTVKRHFSHKLQQILTHLMINALDHGIEQDAQRHAAGKPVPGVLQLEARAGEQHIYLRFWDDGRGLHTTRMREMFPSQEDSVHLEAIFRSGVSTQGMVTHTSGRGVGLDAVRRMISEHGGQIVARYRDEPQQGAAQQDAAQQGEETRALVFEMKLPRRLFGSE